MGFCYQKFTYILVCLFAVWQNMARADGAGEPRSRYVYTIEKEIWRNNNSNPLEEVSHTIIGDTYFCIMVFGKTFMYDKFTKEYRRTMEGIAVVNIKNNSKKFIKIPQDLSPKPPYTAFNTLSAALYSDDKNLFVRLYNKIYKVNIKNGSFKSYIDIPISEEDMYNNSHFVDFNTEKNILAYTYRDISKNCDIINMVDISTIKIIKSLIGHCGNKIRGELEKEMQIKLFNENVLGIYNRGWVKGFYKIPVLTSTDPKVDYYISRGGSVFKNDVKVVYSDKKVIRDFKGGILKSPIPGIPPRDPLVNGLNPYWEVLIGRNDLIMEYVLGSGYIDLNYNGFPYLNDVMKEFNYQGENIVHDIKNKKYYIRSIQKISSEYYIVHTSHDKSLGGVLDIWFLISKKEKI